MVYDQNRHIQITLSQINTEIDSLYGKGFAQKNPEMVSSCFQGVLGYQGMTGISDALSLLPMVLKGASTERLHGLASIASALNELATSPLMGVTEIKGK